MRSSCDESGRTEPSGGKGRRASAVICVQPETDVIDVVDLLL